MKIQHRLGFRKKITRDLREFKKSDTLFILGSGVSILELSKTQLAEIQEHDSFGFNFWLLHKFVPTYYTAEFKPNSDRSDMLWENLAVRAEEYSDTPVFFKYSKTFRQQREKIPEQLKERYLTSHLSIPGMRESSFRNWLKFLDRTGLLAGKTLGGLILFRQASLSWLLVFALRLNYKKIIFCGVDLNSPSYFYDVDSPCCSQKGLFVPEAGFTTPVHPTNNVAECKSGLPISKIVEIFDRDIFPRHKVKLFIGSESSALYPMLPLYQWQEPPLTD